MDLIQACLLNVEPLTPGLCRWSGFCFVESGKTGYTTALNGELKSKW
jgi:hypothetical protein